MRQSQHSLPRVRSTHSPRTPWSRRRSLIVLAGLLTLLGLGYVSIYVLIPELTGGGCSPSERAVLEEFPHYSDQRLSIYSGEVSCNARYNPVATRSEVLSYYDERLHENGWNVGGYWAANPPQGIEVFGEKVSDLEEAPEEGVRSGLEARRGEYTYIVEYFPPGSPSATSLGASEEEAMVTASVTDEQGAGGKVK